MEKKQLHDLYIEVRGRDKASTVYLCQVVQDAMISAGVEKVEIVNQQGDHVRHKSVPSLLDIIESYDPSFFTSNITIQFQPEVVAVVEEELV